MSRSFAATCSFFVLLAGVLHAQSPTAAQESAFLDKVKAALAHKDYVAFSALTCHDGKLDPAVHTMMDKLSRDAFDTVLSPQVSGIGFSPVPTSQVTSFTFQGKPYEINLQPVGELQIRFNNVAPNQFPQSIQFPLGLKDGNLMIATTKEKGS